MIDRSVFSNRNLEERYSIVVMLIGIIFFVINIAIDFRNSNPIFVFASLFLLTFCLLGIYTLGKRKFQKQVINIFSVVLLFVFSVLLFYSSGPHGSMVYTLQVLTVITVLITNGRMRVIVSIVLTFIVIVIQSDWIRYTVKVSYQGLYSDFLVNLFFLSLILVVFKRSLDKEEIELKTKNEDLKRINAELEIQSTKLTNANKEVQEMRNDLQIKVVERTKKFEEENKRLVEFSFINAHLVRAPLANILGLAQLNENDAGLEELREGIQEMDQVVRKIADVLK